MANKTHLGKIRELMKNYKRTTKMIERTGNSKYNKSTGTNTDSIIYYTEDWSS